MINLNNIKPDRFLTYIFIILALTIPGIGILYTLPDETLNLDIYKFVVFSIFFSLPIFLMSIHLISLAWEILPGTNKIRDKDEKDLVFMFLSSFVTLVIFYIASWLRISIKYFSPNFYLNKFGPLTLTYGYSITTTLLTCLALILIYKKPKKGSSVITTKLSNFLDYINIKGKGVFKLERFVKAFLFAVQIGLGVYLGNYFLTIGWFWALIFVTIFLMIFAGRLLDMLYK